MEAIKNILSRAESLRDETAIGSVTPRRVGSIMCDTLKAINEYHINTGSLILHKVYASVDEMAQDANPTSDLTGKDLKLGQMVIVISDSQGDPTGGDIYRYDGSSDNTSAWTFVFKLVTVPADAELDATSTNPLQNKVVTEKLTELKERVDENEVLIADLQDMKIDKEADDYYPQLSVGVADNLSGVDVVDSNFTFRRSGGGAIADGVARVQSIKGNSIVWNQLVGIESQDNSKSANGVIITDNRDGTYSVVTTSQGASANIFIQVGSGKATIANHRYVLYGGAQGGAYGTYQLYATNGFPSQLDDFGNGAFGTAQGGDTYIVLMVRKGCVINTPIRFSPKFTDLTKMFGEGNEPTTIAEFYSRIPMGVDLNAYNEGEIIDCKVEGIVSVGRNAWDEQWERGIIGVSDGQNYPSDASIRTKNFIRILPNTEYYKSCPTLSFYWHIYFDQDKKFIGYAGHTMNNKFTTPPNAYYMKSYSEDGYGNTYKNDICINLSDPDFNGQYEPYLAVGEDLSIARKYFPNGMRSAGNARDEIRYNKATNRWEKVQRIGEVNLGSLAWNYSQGVFITYISDMKEIANTNVAVMAKYSASKSVYGEELYDNVENKVYKTNGGAVGGVTSLAISDSDFNNATSFKAAMQGVILYYELAEPIVTEIEETDFNLDFSVWNNGTEQAIAEGKSSALSADITYGFNAVGLLKQIKAALQAAGILA